MFKRYALKGCGVGTCVFGKIVLRQGLGIILAEGVMRLPSMGYRAYLLNINACGSRTDERSGYFKQHIAGSVTCDAL